MSILDIFRKDEIRVPATPPEIINQKRRMMRELLKTKENIHTIQTESRKMVRQIDVAIRIAVATGGLK